MSTGPVPKLVSSAFFPQFDSRLAGYAALFAVSLASSNTAQAGEYQFGTHAAAIYESQFKGAIFPPAAPLHRSVFQPIGFIAAGPQLADFTVQAQLFDPEPLPQRPLITPIAAAPQSIDLTLQGFVTTPLLAPAAPQALITPIGAAPQSIDLTIQGAIWLAVPRAQGRAPPLILAGPQGVDLAIQGSTFAPSIEIQRAWFGQLIASPQSVDLTIQGFVTAPLPSAPQPCFGPLGAAPQSVELTLQGHIWGAPPGAQGNVPAIVQAPPQAVDLTLAGATFAPSSPKLNPAIAPIFAGPQSADLTLAARIFAPQPGIQGRAPPLLVGIQQADPTQIPALLIGARPAIPNPIAGVFVTLPQFEERTTATIFRSVLAGQTPPHIGQIAASPQLADFTQQATLTAPVELPVSAVQRVFGAPQFVDLTIQGWILGAAPVRQARVPPLVQGAPQLVDLTLQPWIIVAQPLATAAVVRKFLAAPQLVDLTIQGFVHGTARPVQGKVPALIVAAPQLLDLTLSAQFGRSITSIHILRGGPRYIIQRPRGRTFSIARPVGRNFKVSAVSSFRFDQKDPAESVKLTFNFAPDLLLLPNVILVGTPTVLSISVVYGTDVNPSAIQNGSPALDATTTQVILPVTGGLDETDYQIRVQCATTDPLTVLELTGVLPVRAQ